MSDMFSKEPPRSGIGGEATTALWRERLYRGLAGQPTPVVLFPESVRSAASLWSGVRAWTTSLRNAGIGSGDAVVSALPRGEALLQLLIACLWEGLSLRQLPPGVRTDVAEASVAELSGSLLVLPAGAEPRGMFEPPPSWVHVPADGGWPDDRYPFTRREQAPRVLEVACALHLGDRGSQTHAHLLASVLTQLNVLIPAGARVLSLAAWQRHQGITGGVLVPLLSADELFLADAADPAGVERLLREEPITHAIIDAESDPALRLVVEQHRTSVIVLDDDSLTCGS